MKIIGQSPEQAGRFSYEHREFFNDCKDSFRANCSHTIRWWGAQDSEFALSTTFQLLQVYLLDYKNAKPVRIPGLGLLAKRPQRRHDSRLLVTYAKLRDIKRKYVMWHKGKNKK